MTKTIAHKCGVTARAGAILFSLAVVSGMSLIQTGCAEISRPKPEPFYAETDPPKQQEFRWSNGGTPKSLDPARAAAAPETDIVRAVFEGLTALDAKSLEAVPGVAESWEPADDNRTWTFHLRQDALWSNGERVTAKDFVRSWKRLARMGPKAANNYLFQNIVGMRSVVPNAKGDEPTDFLHSTPQLEPATGLDNEKPRNNYAASKRPLEPVVGGQPVPQTGPESEKQPEADSFGIVAIDDVTLRVTLAIPDADLPKLVANPVFSPVFGDGSDLEKDGIPKGIVANGAFVFAGQDDGGLTLVRSEHYWNNKAVGLDRVRFVPMNSAEEALNAYRAGDLDAVTNANFEPLAIKLLAPFDDFKRTTHSALNYYEINHKRVPFTDRRVREALAISIDRDRLTQSELEGSAQPAHSYLPLGGAKLAELTLDVEKAKGLLETAGYPDGASLGTIKLVVNRNETQQRVAKAIARMWKQNLNLDTEIIVKETSEMDEVRRTGEYDIIRRGAVMPTTDELVNLISVFGMTPPENGSDDKHKTAEPPAVLRNDESKAVADKRPAEHQTPLLPFEPALPVTAAKPGATVSEDHAVFSIYAIPLYFPTSYSLVKPYVHGFEINGLDAPSLQDVGIDNDWQPKMVQGES